MTSSNPADMLRQHPLSDDKLGKRTADVNDPAFVLREGLFARSRPVDNARTIMPSFGRAAAARLGQINVLLQDELREDM